MESLWQCFHKGTTVEPHLTPNLCIQPLHCYDHFFPTQMLIHWVSLLFWRAVNATTSLLRPGFYGRTVVTVFAFQYFTKWLWMRRFCRILVLATSTFIIFGCFHMKSRKVCNKTMSFPALFIFDFKFCPYPKLSKPSFAQLGRGHIFQEKLKTIYVLRI